MRELHLKFPVLLLFGTKIVAKKTGQKLAESRNFKVESKCLEVFSVFWPSLFLGLPDGLLLLFGRLKTAFVVQVADLVLACGKLINY